MLTRNQQQICSSDGNWLRSYLQTGWQCEDQKKRGHLLSNDGAERLGGKHHFIYANETVIPKTVQCVRIVKSRVSIVKLYIIVQHAPANLDLIPEIVLNYSTRR
jgi:hypothetical protein